MLFQNWQSLARIFVVGVLSYIILVGFLRLSGNRALSKMNSFDLVVTVALGSTLASGILDKNVSLADASFSFFILIGLQFTVSWLSVRFEKFDELVKSEPVLLYHGNKFLHAAMRKQRVTKDDILFAIRNQGIPTAQEVQAVILEPNGTLNCIKRSDHSRN